MLCSWLISRKNVFVFDSLVTYLPFFLFLAFIGVMFAVDSSVVPAEKRDAKKQTVSNPPLPAVLILLAIFSVGGYWFSIRPALGAYFAVEALKTNPNDIDAVTGYFKRSLSYGNASKNAEIRGRIADYSTQLLGDEKISLDKRKSVLEFAVQEVTKAPKKIHLISEIIYIWLLSCSKAVLSCQTTAGILCSRKRTKFCKTLIN